MARGAARTGGSRRRPHGAWLVAHLRAAREGWWQLRNNRLASLVSIAVMATALGLPTTLFALLENQQTLFSEWGAEPTLSVFLTRGTSESQARELAARWREIAEIGKVEVVSSTEAFAEFAATTGLITNGAQSANPLPHVLVVTPAAAAWEVGDGQPLVALLRRYVEVDSVLVDLAWVARLRAMSALAARAVWVLGLVLVGAMVLIVGNTIRVLVQEQIAEIEVLKLVGATDAFVRRPFLYSGALHGMVAGILGVILIEGVFFALSGPVEAVASAYLSGFTLVSPAPDFVATVIALATATGWSGAWLGTLHCLRQFDPTSIK